MGLDRCDKGAGAAVRAPDALFAWCSPLGVVMGDGPAQSEVRLPTQRVFPKEKPRTKTARGSLKLASLSSSIIGCPG